MTTRTPTAVKMGRPRKYREAMDQMIGLRLPPGLYSRLARACEYRGVQPAELVREILDATLPDHQADTLDAAK